MNTLTKVLASIILAIVMMSCNFTGKFGTGINGNGNVITKERAIKESFNSVKISRGLELQLTQGDTESLKVEADENLHDIITTTVENKVLTISTTDNIGESTAQKILLSFKNIISIKATSGSEVYSTNTIQVEDLKLDTTSGSDLELSINATSISCHSTSGSNIELKGKAEVFIAEASSGSSIEAENLIAKNAQVKSSSGANIVVNAIEKLTAKASSGGDVKYIGNPEVIEKSDGVSGSIKRE
ncbi:MAG TPA: head GIN domain-containing protein [Xanthomarina sp.]|nr:head GIN domain-containing protein [Xanthomarina sp.]